MGCVWSLPARVEGEAVKARNVKPGMLVKDDAGVWQVVVELGHYDEPSTANWAMFANGSQEDWRPGDDVEVAKLTDVQRWVLAAVEADAVHVDWLTVDRSAHST